MRKNGWFGEKGKTGARSLWIVVGILLVAGAGKAVAGEKEVRDFNIFVDNKKVGSYEMTIHKEDNGVFSMTGKAVLKVTYLVYTYSYAYQGAETWHDGRLQGLRSRTNDNGKKFEVTALATKDGLHVTVNGRARMTRGDVWLTSYWRLPVAKFRNQPVPLLDADSGKDIAAELKYVGLEMVAVGGQQIKCQHYKVTGTPSPVDLWYDAQERLVRQTSVEQGHRTLLHMTGARR